MKCHKCEVCGKEVERDLSGVTLCVPVIIGSGGGDTANCWCVCEDCKDEFLQRSAKVLQEIDIKSLPH